MPVSPKHTQLIEFKTSLIQMSYNLDQNTKNSVHYLSSYFKRHLEFVPRVEADKNTSTIIPASRKRRQEGSPVVSGDVTGDGKGTELVAGDVRGDGKGTELVSGDVRGDGKGTEFVSGDIRGYGKGTQTSTFCPQGASVCSVWFSQ
jgi:hypothetical protein